MHCALLKFARKEFESQDYFQMPLFKFDRLKGFWATLSNELNKLQRKGGHLRTEEEYTLVSYAVWFRNLE